MKTLESPAHAVKLPSGRLLPMGVNAAAVAGILPVFAAASCPGVVAHIVSEQAMITDAKRNAVVILVRLCCIGVSFGFGFSVFTFVPRLFFGSCTNVFLLAKAETGSKTRQVFGHR